jgi:hypothetical protein
MSLGGEIAKTGAFYRCSDADHAAESLPQADVAFVTCACASAR